MDALLNLAGPVMENISPEMLQKLSAVAGKLGDRMKDSGEKFSLDSIKTMIEEDSDLRTDMGLMIGQEQADILLPPIKVTLDVKSTDFGKTKKFRAKPNCFNVETLQIEKKSTLFKLKLVKDQNEYTIESEEHGRVFVELNLKK